MSIAPRSEALLGPLEMFGVRLGLERVREHLRRLGDPHLGLSVVLVAGTNGKGSTSALLASMAQAAGYRTGLYTSPHLEAVTERLAVDGQAIRDEVLAAYLEALPGMPKASFSSDEAASNEAQLDETRSDETRSDETPPTYFEALTLAAFQFFRDAEVDLAVIEVGLGGRLDATNVSEPVLSVITPISLDHERQLGSTLESVASEKAGILRRHRPAVAWTEEPTVETTLRARAEELPCALLLAAHQVEIFPHAGQPGGSTGHQRLDLRTPGGRYRLDLALPGRHQRVNLALAVLAAEALKDQGWTCFDRESIRRGAASCRWPGRLEAVELPHQRVLLDAAHNPAGAQALAEVAAGLPEPPDLLFGAQADKAVESMLPPLAAVADRVVLTRPPGRTASSAGAEPEDWRRWVPGVAAVVEPDPERALEYVLEPVPPTSSNASSARRIVLVCGSIYLVGLARRWLRERFGVPPTIAGDRADLGLERLDQGRSG